MKTKSLLLITCLILSSVAFGQKEGNVWYFGEQLGLNFNSNVPFIDSNSLMSTIQGAATICDASGNLLFYTNGGDRLFPGSNSVDPGKTRIDHLDHDNNIRIFPNPSDGVINFELSLEAERIQSIEILNIESKILINRTGTDIQNINIQDLSTGVYFARLTTKGGQVITKRIMKY